MDTDKSGPTIKEIARASGFSIGAVSLALRGSSKISTATSQKIRAAAETLGYRPNPLVAALMSRIRSSRPIEGFLPLAAPLFNTTLKEFNENLYYREMLAGASKRAREHGYQLEVFEVGDGAMRLAQFNSILRHRNVPGILIPPAMAQARDLPIDWARFSVVGLGYFLREIHFHRISPDHYQGMMLVLEKARKLGYRRIGLVLDAFTERRVDHRWLAAFHWFNSQIPEKERVPAVVLEQEGGNEADLKKWLNRHKVDVVITHRGKPFRDLLTRMNRQIPGDIGIIHMNWTDGNGEFAGLHQMPEVLGRAALDALVAQIQRNEKGLPSNPKIIMVEGEWMDGPTVSPRS